MKRWFTIIFAVIALALLIGALTNSTRRPRAMFGPTYTPSQVTIGGTGWQVLVGGKLYRLQLGQHFYLRGAIWPSVSFLLTQSNVPDNYYADEGGCRIVVVGQNGQSSTLSGLGSLHAKQRQGPSFCSPVESGERVD